MFRLAAVGDLHITLLGTGTVIDRFRGVNEVADVLLLPGDLTNGGEPSEAKLLIRELRSVVKIPMVAVLGNHDQHAGKSSEVAYVFKEGGITVLDGDIWTHKIGDLTLGIVGTKGFQGGFGKNGVVPGFETAVDVWVREADAEAAKIRRALTWLKADYRVVMMHYAPIRGTVEGEPLELVPFMGTDRLCEPIDELGAHLVVHGHSHHGTHAGITPGGIPVYNVAAAVMDVPYAILELS